MSWWPKQISIDDYYHIPGHCASLYYRFLSIYKPYGKIDRLLTMKCLTNIVDTFASKEQKIDNTNALVRYFFRKEHGNIYNDFVKKSKSISGICNMFDYIPGG